MKTFGKWLWPIFWFLLGILIFVFLILIFLEIRPLNNMAKLIYSVFSFLGSILLFKGIKHSIKNIYPEKRKPKRRNPFLRVV